MGLCHLKYEVWGILVRQHHVVSLVKDVSLSYKLIHYVIYGKIGWKNIFPPVILNVDTKTIFDSRLTKMALCHKKCELLSNFAKAAPRRFVDKDFCLM